MPRPEQTPAPQIKRGKGPQALPYGAATAANRGTKGALGIGMPYDEQAFQPSSPAEEFLFSGTDRPSEPLTSGVPFGPGSNVYIPPGVPVTGREAAIPGADELPERVRRNLPLLQQLAAEPDAPPQLRVIVDFLRYSAG